MAILNPDYFFILFYLCLFTLAIPEPRSASWSSKTFGPDGPWNAVEVTIGNSNDKIALYPGHVFHSVIVSTDYCRLNSSLEHCDAGNYSTANADFSEGPILFRTPVQEWMAGIPISGNGTHMILDKIDLGFKDDNTDIILDASLAVVTDGDQMLTLPSGTRYPGFVGCLSLGAPEPNQTFTQISGAPLNSSIIPWALLRRDATSSASFGLHLGSGILSSRVPGSLIWGGYDLNRVISPVNTLDGFFSTPLLLKDIALTVVRGASPFPFTSKIQPGLLARGDATSASSAGLPVVVDPCSPYLSLPKSTCDTIASFLPVTYSPSLGLYLWDINSPSTSTILSSASALSFTFLGANNTQNFTIHIPFPHLNLTLSPPLSDRPISYFPCSTSSGTGASVLGRAFLQDVFLAANWEMRKVFLAQAPGPNIQPGANVVDIERKGISVQSGGNDWVTSWEGFWIILAEEEVERIYEPEDTADESGLTVGAKAGLGVGIVLGLATTCGVAFWWRRKKRKVPEISRGQSALELSQGDCNKGVFKDGSGPFEADGFEKHKALLKMETSGRTSFKTIGEMDGTGRNSLGRGTRHKSKLSLYELA